MAINYWQKFDIGLTYHLYNRAINKEKLFINEGNYIFFLQQFKKYISPFTKTYAYCLIPNHFHFIIQIEDVNDQVLKVIQKDSTKTASDFLNHKIDYNTFLEQQFKRLFSSYAQAFNKQQKRRSSLFEKRFKRVQIRTEHKLLQKIHYVHHNPIHHYISNNYSDWKFSSYHSYFSSSPTLISKNDILLQFDNNLAIAKKEFMKFHEDNIFITL